MTLPLRAVYLEQFDPDDPPSAVSVGDRPAPEPPAGWTVVDVRAAALNHHDVWSARGIGLREESLPMILGCDAAGTDPDGNEVIVHAVVTDPAWLGPEELDPKLSLLSERHQGTLAEQVAVPAANLVAKPEQLSFAEAACLPTAWLTAYRMLFVQADVRPGDTVLVQGSSGGLSTACIALGAAAGVRMWATGRSQEKRDYATSLGAEQTFDVGERLPDRVDAVMESVGAATWKHSQRSLRKGGTMVVSGGTSGYAPEADVARIFANNLRIQGSTMGTKEELERLVAFLLRTGIRPEIDEVLPLDRAADGLRKLVDGTVRGKVVLEP
jgi:NADPH:quinone reductase-like Zn-dependent oxidoreductase